MRKAIIACAFVTGVVIYLLIQKAYSTPSVQDYFPVVQGAQYEYDTLEPAPNGGKKWSVVKCLGIVGPNDPNTYGFKEDVYMGTPSVVNTNVLIYTLDDKTVKEDAVGNSTIGENDLTNYFILKLPKIGQVIKWVAEDRDDTSYFKAYFGSVKTDYGTYPDCIVIEKTTSDDGDVILNKYYYAKKIGLVKEDVYGKDQGDKNLTFSPQMSLELVKTSI